MDYLYLSHPGVPGSLDAAHAEQLEDEKLAYVTNMVAVGGEGHVLVLAGHGRSAAAVHVVRLHHLPRLLRRRDHHRRHRAETQKHDGAMLPRERPQAPVRQWANLVQVAEEGQRLRTGRQIQG